MARGRGRATGTTRRVPGLCAALVAYHDRLGQQWNSDHHRQLADDYANGLEVATTGQNIWHATFNPNKPNAADLWIYDERTWLVRGDVATLADPDTPGGQHR